MLRISVILLSLAVTLGTVLALWHLRASEGRGGPPRMVGLLHGALGITGLAALILLLQGPRRGDAMGAGSFGVIAAALFASALVAGLAIPSLIRRSPPGAAITVVVHASLAIIAYVLFLAWASLG
jgi:hypothetical protein